MLLGTFSGMLGCLRCSTFRPIFGCNSVKCPWFLRQYFRLDSMSSYQTRYNALDIQMLSKSLHEQIFGHQTHDGNTDLICRSIEHLSKHNLYGRKGTHLPDVDFQLPPLHGSTIEEHFINIAKKVSKNYFEMAERIAKVKLPCRPKQWSFEAGWMKYTLEGDMVVSSPVEYPVGDVMVFDVEVCVNEGQFPTMAVLATPDNW